MALEEDIYEMYRDGPYDWFNPLDFMTSTLTGGPSGSWSEKTHSEKIFEITKQYPNLNYKRCRTSRILAKTEKGFRMIFVTCIF
jgi:hypothetical protein